MWKEVSISNTIDIKQNTLYACNSSNALKVDVS